jgi:hypothetical protein
MPSHQSWRFLHTLAGCITGVQEARLWATVVHACLIWVQHIVPAAAKLPLIPPATWARLPRRMMLMQANSTGLKFDPPHPPRKISQQECTRSAKLMMHV